MKSKHLLFCNCVMKKVVPDEGVSMFLFYKRNCDNVQEFIFSYGVVKM